MGFKDAKHELLQALLKVRAGEVLLFHEPRRPGEEAKNALEQGTVSLADVEAMVRLSQAGEFGRNYSTGHHHNPAQWPGITVHELKRIRWQGNDWYVKWFFDEPDLFFISVHPSTPSPNGMTS